jgi:polysaccharide biosynthesis transport protein
MSIQEKTNRRLGDGKLAPQTLPESQPVMNQRVSAVGSNLAVRSTNKLETVILPALSVTDTASLIDYIEIPFVHWRLIFSSFVLSLLAGITALMLWPRSYESEAKLMLKVGRESVALDPTATTSQTLMLQKTQEEEVNSALEVLSSRQVAEIVVDKLGAAPILEGVLPSDLKSTEDTSLPKKLKSLLKQGIDWLSDSADHSLLFIGIKDPISERERAIRKVMHSVGIYAPKRSTAVTIRAESKTPQMAQALATAVTDGFLDRHFSVSRTEGSYEFFQVQSDTVEAQLNRLLETRSRSMQKFKVASTEDKRRILTDQFGAIEQNILHTRGELEQARAEINDLVAKANNTPAEIVAATAEQTDLTWSGMRQRIYELEILEQQYATMYAADNPKLTRVREQLNGAKDILAGLSKDGITRQMTPNPVRIRIEEDLQRLQTRVVGYHSMLEEKEKQRNEINNQIDSLLVFELELTEMNRNISLLENSLNLLKLKLEEARVIDELQADRISNISIYQPATLVERPASPSKPLLAVLFPALGLMCGLGLALVREIGSHSLRTPAHVEAKLGIPLLTSIPFSRALKKLKNLAITQHMGILAPHCAAILSEMLTANRQVQHSRGCSIGVIGVDDKCGASTIAAALAMSAGQNCELLTVLIDADVKQATISHSLGLKNYPGLIQLLNGVAEQAECVQQSNNPRLSLIGASGVASPEESTDVDPQAFANLLAELQMDHDVVIVDLPPMSRPDRAGTILPYLDFIVVVIESEVTDEASAKRLLRRFAGNNQTIGLVLNKTRSHMPRLLSRLIT